MKKMRMILIILIMSIFIIVPNSYASGQEPNNSVVLNNFKQDQSIYIQLKKIESIKAIYISVNETAIYTLEYKENELDTEFSSIEELSPMDNFEAIVAERINKEENGVEVRKIAEGTVLLEKGKIYGIYTNGINSDLTNIQIRYKKEENPENVVTGSQGKPYLVNIPGETGSDIFTLQSDEATRTYLYKKESIYFKVATTGSYIFTFSMMDGITENLNQVKIYDERDKLVDWSADGSYIADYNCSNFGEKVATWFEEINANNFTAKNGGRILEAGKLYRLYFGNISALASTEMPVKYIGFIKVSDSTQTYLEGVEEAKKEKDYFQDYELTSTKSKTYDMGKVSDFNTEPNVSMDENIIEKVASIAGTLNGIGVIISVIVLTILGVKYMLGSVEEKATYKETLKPYIIGVVMLTMGTTILNVIAKMASLLV